jgi:hypothetical protein
MSGRHSRNWHENRPSYVNYTALDDSRHPPNTSDRSSVSIHSDGQIYPYS